MLLTGILTKEFTYTAAALGAGATFNGVSSVVRSYRKIRGVVFADQAGTLYIRQGGAGGQLDEITSLPLAAGVGFGFKIDIVGMYCQVTYTNGGVAQAAFRLYTFLEP